MPNYIDLFSGCGGLSLGLKNSGWTGIFAVEKNADAFATFKKNLIDNNNHFNWPEWLPVSNHDIKQIYNDYQDELNSLKGKIDLIAGGPPCQGFSLAGKRDSDDIRNTMVEYYLKFVEKIYPQLIFFENVHGFTIPFKGKDKPYSVYVKEQLEKIGYNTSDFIIDVSKMGIPQKRKRFILIGFLKSINFDILDTLNDISVKFLNERNLNTTVTIKEAISDLLKINGTRYEKKYPSFLFGNYGEHINSYQRYMNKNIIVPDSHRFANHRKDTIELFEYLSGLSNDTLRLTPRMDDQKRLKKRSVTILKENSICGTITSIPDDYIHYSEPRIMTVREYARIQSFPDDYIFLGKYTTGGKLRKDDVPRYTQIANAIPPLFSEQIGILLNRLLLK